MIEDVERHCGKDLAEPVGIAMVERADHVDVLRYMCEVPLYQGLSLALTTLKDVVQYLCELPRDQGVDPSAEGNHAIRAAAAHGHVDVVRYLCELPRGRGVNPSAHCNFAIRAAAQHGHVDVVRCLCELPSDRGVDPAARDNNAIVWAVHNGHLDVVRYLSEFPANRGVNPAACGNAAIRSAARYGHVNVVRYLSGVLSSHSQHIQCTPRDVPPNQAVQCLYQVHAMALAATWKRRPGFGEYHTLFARMSARRPVLVLHSLVRERRCKHGGGRAQHDVGREVSCLVGVQ